MKISAESRWALVAVVAMFGCQRGTSSPAGGAASNAASGACKVADTAGFAAGAPRTRSPILRPSMTTTPSRTTNPTNKSAFFVALAFAGLGGGAVEVGFANASGGSGGGVGGGPTDASRSRCD